MLLDSLSKCDFELEELPLFDVHDGAIEMVGILPVIFAVVHRGIGSLEQFIQGLSISWNDGNPDAAGDAEGKPLHRDLR